MRAVTAGAVMDRQILLDVLTLRLATSGDVRRACQAEVCLRSKEAMVFQVRKWGWKRLASKLLLIPVLTGGAATVAHAQFGSGSSLFGGSSSNSNMSTPAAQTGGTSVAETDPQAILKEGRKALAAGQFDKAQDLSRAAEAANKSGKWGLFDDTPNSLRKDIQAAHAKAQKNQASMMAREAKALLAKPAATDAERAANLDKAYQLAQNAERLHGSYSAWEFEDRADKLVKEIQAARSHMQSIGTASSVTQANSTSPPSLSTSAGAMSGRTATTDAKKAAALQLMAEAKKLDDQGLFGQAKAKLIEADRLQANFGPSEYSPTWALQELNKHGADAINRLIVESKAQMIKKDYSKAEAALTGATDVATSLGLYARPIEDTRALLRKESAGKFGTGTLTAQGSFGNDSSVAVKPLASNTPPSMLPGVGSLPGNSLDSKPLQTTGSGLTAKQLLDQADIEFRNGEMETASRLAQQAHNLGAQDEARRLLNSIDAERLRLKTISAGLSFEHAVTAAKSKDYNYALGVLVLIDPMLLTPEQKSKREELLATCRVELNKDRGAAVATASATQTAEPPILPQIPDSPASPGLNPPGTARVGGDPKSSADSMASQVEAMNRIQFQKLRTEGLKILTDANTAFGRGETDIAMQMLVDYSTRVRASNLEPSNVSMLLRPIDSRMEVFRKLKGNTDAIARINRDNQEAKQYVASHSGTAEEQRKDEVKRLFEKYRTLVKAQKYVEAEKVAMQAKQLDPDNPATTALAEMAKLQRAVKEAEKLKEDKEVMFRTALNGAEREGAYVDIDDPVRFSLERSKISRLRGSGDNGYVRSHTQATYEIELKLNKPISIDFKQTPLEQAVENLKTLADIPMIIDLASLEAEGISPVKPITVNPGHSISVKNMLAVTLEQAGLSYVIEHDMVKVTTAKKAKGRLFTKVFSVADLVTPVPNFALPDYVNLEKMMAMATNGYGSGSIRGFGAGVNAMGGGQLPGTQASMPGISMPGQSGGTLQTNPIPDKANPLGFSVTLAGDKNTKHEQLMKLITGMVRPYSWDGMGGPGRLEYYDIGSALVVNQTADVIAEVADLLEALRRLQDLAMSVEVRIVSLSESWYERMGVDLSLNISTDSRNQRNLQTQLTQVDGNTGAAGVFAPIPFINSLGKNIGATVGLTPAGTFTPDLNVPITNSSFSQAVPPFGGYPNTPGADGGVSLGLAFLNDIQVYLFMEAAAGDRRVNVMQAPKLTLFNGQTASISIANTQFFVTNVQVISVNGQIVFAPTNSPFPGPGDPFNPLNTGGNGTPATVTVTVQGVVSADRRFVRLNLPVQISAQTGTTVPLFPITTFVTPAFEGGSQGQPIPFTQFLQQPAFTDLNINTTVVCPDGGTVLLGGFKQLSEGRNEYGPPFLSDIPYISRLFKNVGIGRETTHIMVMVTPRIIINSEEEIFQTEGARQQP